MYLSSSADEANKVIFSVSKSIKREKYGSKYCRTLLVERGRSLIQYLVYLSIYVYKNERSTDNISEPTNIEKYLRSNVKNASIDKHLTCKRLLIALKRLLL